MGMIFNRGAYGLLNRDIDFENDTIRARLSRTSETLSKDATSMTGLGVTATDLTLAGCIYVEDLTNDRIVLDANDPTFLAVAAGAEVDKMIVFKFVTNDAGSTPIAVVDITPVTPNGGAIAVTLPADGLAYLQQ